MLASIKHNDKTFNVDLSKPIDISIPLRKGAQNVSAWYVDPVRIEPVITDRFTGDVNMGGSVNFKNIMFNPHGNGTHTECVGHISKKEYSINQCLKNYFFIAQLITVIPEKQKTGDEVITKHQIEESLNNKFPEALIIRTLPNMPEKINKQYSNTNPPYIDHAAMEYIVKKKIMHFLTDLPSVDREYDDGKLLAHKAFWQYPDNIRESSTITELVYVPNHVKDGEYLLNISFASFENDASPGKPLLYHIF